MRAHNVAAALLGLPRFQATFRHTHTVTSGEMGSQAEGDPCELSCNCKENVAKNRSLKTCDQREKCNGCFCVA